MSLRVILTRGLPGSGKSTWASGQVKKNPGVYKRINKDSLRAMLDCSYHTDFNEQFVLEMRDTMILKALDYGKNVVVDDTNFEPKHESEIRTIVEDWNSQQKLYGKKGNATVEVKFFDLPLEECIERDANRINSVGKKVIMEMYNRYLKPKEKQMQIVEKPIYDPKLPDAIICDLDGTLALLNGRNPYDASTCRNDLINEPIAEILRSHNRYAPFAAFKFAHIIFVSGREEKYRMQSEEWLKEIANINGTLFMRPTGDLRKDAIIKQEIYEREIKGKYNVLFVLDDRNQTVAKWRELSLVCLQVADGNF